MSVCPLDCLITMKCQQNLATWIKTGKTGCSGLFSEKGNKGNTKKGKVTQVTVYGIPLNPQSIIR